MNPDGHADSVLVLNADRALLLCAKTWGMPAAGTSEAPAWERLDQHWRDRLKSAAAGLEALSPADALGFLSESHRLQCRVEPRRVHPSWWVRALEGESPAVRRLVASHGPLSAGEAASPGSGVDSVGLPAGPCPHAEAVEWVLALWSERLVGGEPPQAAEPPVILALATLSPRSLYRLCHAMGLALTTLAEDPEGLLTGRAAWSAQRDWFQDWFGRQLGGHEAEFRSSARIELVGSARSETGTPRRKLATRGLTALARLLVSVDPHRVRWAIQHVPYPIAKRIRSVMARTKNPADEAPLESLLLKGAGEWLARRRAVAVMMNHPEDARRRAEGSDVD